MKRIPPSKRIRKGIDDLLKEGTTDNVLGRILHEGMRRIVQELYEAEAGEMYARGLSARDIEEALLEGTGDMV